MFCVLAQVQMSTIAYSDRNLGDISTDLIFWSGATRATILVVCILIIQLSTHTYTFVEGAISKTFTLIPSIMNQLKVQLSHLKKWLLSLLGGKAKAKNLYR